MNIQTRIQLSRHWRIEDNIHINNMTETIKTREEIVSTLRQLALEDIARLETLPKPLVRVCGPWTTGGWGLEENLRRYKAAVEALESRGFTVVDYFESEKVIKTLGAEHADIMREYHEPILGCGLISEAFFMPKWQESKGSIWEKDFFEKNTDTKIVEMPDEWIQEKLNK